MRQWFFMRDGQRKGPYTDDQLRALASSGKLLPEDLVSYTGANKWLPARDVPNLYSATPPPASPAPPPSAAPSGEAPRSLLQPLLALPKPLLFALFGGTGGLLGALLLGELLWALLSPAAFRPAPPPPPRPAVRPPEPNIRLGIPSVVHIFPGGSIRFAVQLGRDDFSGAVRLAAQWIPAGIHITAISIPEDSNRGRLLVEATPDLKTGRHTLTLVARAQAGEKVVTGEGIFDVEVDPLPPQIGVSAPRDVPIFQGGKVKFGIKLARYHFTGPVQLRFDGLPEGTALPATTVAKDQSEAAFTLQAAESTRLGEWPVKLIATASGSEGELQKETPFTLRVRSVPVPQADIVFVVDLTASMQYAIDGIKLGIQSFARELESRRLDSRIGLIGFRDLDEGAYGRPFVMTVRGEAFTKDYESFAREVGKLRAGNSGRNLDVPESCLQALDLAAKQSFRGNASRVLLLITDAIPKIHPGESPSTVPQTLAVLANRKINQFHLVVRSEDYRAVYAGFHDSFKGKFFDLNRSTNAEAFKGILPELSRHIAVMTIASRPRTLEKILDPKALPPASVAPPPPAKVEAREPPPPPVKVVEVVKAVQSTQAYTRRDSRRLLVAIAVWTMAIAGCISLLILAGQRFYTCQRFVGLAEGINSLGGGFLAGLAGGAAGQFLFQNTAGGTAWEATSRLLGWGLLGGLVGSAISFFVPNLKLWRGLAGGLLGGLVGAGAFVLVSRGAGAFLGRWIGAGILGFFIGLMVALAELAFRRYWLEVAFGPREIRTVTLGLSPVSLGSDERRVAVAIPGGPPIVLRYWLDGERVLCEDVIKERTGEVVPGDRKTLGKVTITLCSAAHGRRVGYTLQLSHGAAFQLVEGLPLTEKDVPGLHAQGTDGVVALVSSRPNDPTQLLLRNRSKETWVVRQAGMGEHAIAPGRGLELSGNASISFGPLQGTLRRDTR